MKFATALLLALFASQASFAAGGSNVGSNNIGCYGLISLDEEGRLAVMIGAGPDAATGLIPLVPASESVKFDLLRAASRVTLEKKSICIDGKDDLQKGVVYVNGVTVE